MRIKRPTQIERIQGGAALFGRPRQALSHVAMVVAGIWIGATIGAPQVADAEIRKGPEREAFLSGGARSEEVLRDIAAIVARMDGRIANIEEAVVQAARAGHR